MYINAIKTHRIETNESLEEILDQYFTSIENKDIVVITSKILSVIEGCFVEKEGITKYELISQEADYILETEDNPYGIYLTIKDDILIPSAGVDESNVDGVYVLYPKNIQAIATHIWKYLKNKNDIDELGVLITDSHTTIMRKGVTGIALAWCGFMPLYSYVNKPDIYGKSLRVTEINILDSLAVSAVFMMGEGNEQTPFAVIKNAPKISFLNRVPTEEEIASIKISIDEDLYAPLLRLGNWLKKMK